MSFAKLPCRCGATIRVLVFDGEPALARAAHIVRAYWRHYTGGGHA